jgi:hypothetical protein
VGIRGNPRNIYSTPLTYKSFENPTSRLPSADESSANAEATNFKPHQFPQRGVYLDKRTFCGLVPPRCFHCDLIASLDIIARNQEVVFDFRR